METKAETTMAVASGPMVVDGMQHSRLTTIDRALDINMEVSVTEISLRSAADSPSNARQTSKERRLAVTEISLRSAADSPSVPSW